MLDSLTFDQFTYLGFFIHLFIFCVAFSLFLYVLNILFLWRKNLKLNNEYLNILIKKEKEESK
ncbi:hypothetical protein HNR74_003455 [Flammeovirga kamogawensis]|nr:hypothetical protein [Flammeovirga kamogawensis]